MLEHGRPTRQNKPNTQESTKNRINVPHRCNSLPHQEFVSYMHEAFLLMFHFYDEEVEMYPMMLVPWCIILYYIILYLLFVYKCSVVCCCFDMMVEMTDNGK